MAVKVLARQIWVKRAFKLPFAPSACPIPGPVTWTTLRGRRFTSTNSTEPNSTPQPPAPETVDQEPPFYSTATKGEGEQRLKEDERAAKQLRRKEVRDIIDNSQADIERSQAWTNARARYPGLSRRQINLIALMWEVIAKTNKSRQRLSPSELFDAHYHILHRDQKNRLEGHSRLNKSSASYSNLLLYAFKHRDSKILRVVAEEALSWKERQTPSRRSPTRRQHRFVHPRVAAADDLSRYVRNLFVSMAIKTKMEIRRNTHGIDGSPSTLQIPNSSLYPQPGDDTMALSAMIRKRVGVLKIVRDEDGKETIRVSHQRHVAHHPLIKRSRRERRINRLSERGRIDEIMNLMLGSKEVDAQVSNSAPQGPTNLPTLAEPAPTKNFTAMVHSGNLEMMELLSNSGRESRRCRQMTALQDSFQSWQLELSRGLETRKTLALVLRQMHIPTMTASHETTEAIRQSIPTWLVLSTLRLHIESGEPKLAEKVIEIYLQSLAKLYPHLSLVEVFTRKDAKVHAVTAPLVPPTSGSLLNAMLRSQLVSGASDCFEMMTDTIEKWCFEGSKFSTIIHQANRPVEQTPDGLKGCLVPDENTISILLQGLRNRHERYSLGLKMIEEAWRRWATISFHDEKNDFLEPQIHHTLSLPLPAMTTLLRWARQSGKKKRIDVLVARIERILALERKWRETAFGGSPIWLGTEVAKKIAWQREEKKAREVLDNYVKQSTR